VEAGTEDHLLGVIRRQDVVARYNREILTRDMASEISRGVEDVSTRTMIPLGDRYLLAELPVPRPLRGTMLQESELRTRYRVEVVMIRPRDGGEAVLPQGDYQLNEDDLLLIVGEREAVQRLYEL
jgi:Trk K+ transport system NAD-binding subunit